MADRQKIIKTPGFSNRQSCLEMHHKHVKPRDAQGTVFTGSRHCMKPEAGRPLRKSLNKSLTRKPGRIPKRNKPLRALHTDSRLTGSCGQAMSLRNTGCPPPPAERAAFGSGAAWRPWNGPKKKKKVRGEIETERQGHLGAQEAYYAGSIKGAGRIYRQTFIDTHTKIAFCKLYGRKNALAAADILNDKAVPFFDSDRSRCFGF